jgi:putative NADPH-quinone reductase
MRGWITDREPHHKIALEFRMAASRPKHVLIIDGHPDRDPKRFVHVLAAAYRAAAESAGHSVHTIRLCDLDFPWLHSAAEFAAAPPAVIAEQQEHLRRADHLVLLYPLWLGSMPALLKAFLEQVLRPGFAFGGSERRGLPKKLLAGKSARIVVTMGMPAVFYRLYYRAHSLKSLERNILAFVGIKPVRATLLGNVEGRSAKARARSIAELEREARLAR